MNLTQEKVHLQKRSRGPKGEQGCGYLWAMEKGSAEKMRARALFQKKSCQPFHMKNFRIGCHASVAYRGANVWWLPIAH
ncbi:hypothetical protein [Roseovarius sp. TE539]|uniref:hypothetical protein n=1 Tax=Roseovarius sp. TE539 TaxID=2249812 RepID=UPI0011BE204F|nr:hypothetical protein [Roseovarius sp. TE539]